jgi:hypothetical protein
MPDAAGPGTFWPEKGWCRGTMGVFPGKRRELMREFRPLFSAEALDFRAGTRKTSLKTAAVPRNEPGAPFISS